MPRDCDGGCSSGEQRRVVSRTVQKKCSLQVVSIPQGLLNCQPGCAYSVRKASGHRVRYLVRTPEAMKEEKYHASSMLNEQKRPCWNSKESVVKEEITATIAVPEMIQIRMEVTDLNVKKGCCQND